jgi:predicted kinase
MARTSLLAWSLLVLGLSWPALANAQASLPRATTQQAHQAVERAVRYLQAECASWLNTRKCAACHHVPLPLWALSEAQRQGYAIDRKFLADTVESLLGSKDRLLASRIFPNPADPPDPRPQGRGLNMGLPMLAVAARSLPALSAGQKQSLELIAGEIVRKQQPDGSWEFFATLRRPPINESQTTDAAWILLALQGEAGPDAPPAQREALTKGRAWLDAAPRSDLYQDRVLKVLLGIRSGKPRQALQGTIDELLALQRADGGWSQTVPGWKSDAFATGQTLYVLALAGLTAERPEIKRGLDFLVATQMHDGSWPMRSRATPDGSPGSATLLTPITCAASSWATLALARLAPTKRANGKGPGTAQDHSRKRLMRATPLTQGGGTMERPNPGPRLILVCGLPGSGKTTRARALEARLPAVRCCPDEWLEALSLDLYDEDRRGKVEALQWRLAQQLLGLGLTVILEWGTWARSERDALRLGARALGAEVELHYLSAPADVLFERIQRRGRENPPIPREAVSRWLEVFQAPTAEEMSHFDQPLLGDLGSAAD